MKIRPLKRLLALMLGLVLALQLPALSASPAFLSFAYTSQSASVNASSLNVRSGPGTEYSSIAKVSRGTTVTVTDETMASDGKKWYQIRLTDGTIGYVLGTYLHLNVTYTYDADFEAQLSAQGFPESYKDYLRQLHAMYPNWIFEAFHTGLDWNNAVDNEMVLPRSLISTNSISSYKSLEDGAYDWNTSTWTGFDGSSWVAASREVLSYYMDPRNSLDEVYIFSFMSHTYDSSIQTREGLSQMVQGTFLAGDVIYGNTSSGTVSGVVSGQDGGQTSPVAPGVIIQGGSGYNDDTSLSGPGVYGFTPGGTVTEPTVSSGDGSVELHGPVASVSQKKTDLLTASVIVGAMPGSDSTQTAVQTDPGYMYDNPSTTVSEPMAQGPTSSVIVAGSSSPSVNMNPAASSSMSYVDMIMEAAQASGVNPYVLAAMILQEQGTNGTGNSISGTVSGYEGYYNYFNVGAYAANGLTAVQRGLWYASQNDSYGRPWTDPEKSIVGGACFYGENYVSAGQNTFYLKKFNVQGSNMYEHQYMTNVDGAASEASFFAEAYTDSMRQMPLRFSIPVYNNMPDTACPIPTVDGSPNNKLSNLEVEGFTLTPTFARDTEYYTLVVDTSVNSVNVEATPISSTASVSGTGIIQLMSYETDIPVTITAQNGSMRTYIIHVVKQNNGPTYSGYYQPGTYSSVTVTEPTVSVIGPGGSVTTSSGTSSTVSDSSPVGSNVTIIY